MKLYYAPGACSLSPHIVLRESGLPFDLEQVDNKEKKTKSGHNFWDVNPKGQVPVLELDEGGRLTEGPVIVQYLADQKPGSGLAPACGTPERYRVPPAHPFERLGRRAAMPFTIFPHMLRHACGYALANSGHDTRALQALGPSVQPVAA
jgi:glutathione S-transferase